MIWCFSYKVQCTICGVMYVVDNECRWMDVIERWDEGWRWRDKVDWININIYVCVCLGVCKYICIDMLLFCIVYCLGQPGYPFAEK